jgi:hypothetical protein
MALFSPWGNFKGRSALKPGKDNNAGVLLQDIPRAAYHGVANSTPLPEADMDGNDWDGTLVLEKLAAIDKVDEFFDAVDEDDFARAANLMKAAQVNAATIAQVLKMMAAADGEH